MTDYTFCPECQTWQMARHEHKESGLEDYLLSLDTGFYVKISDFDHSREVEIHGLKRFPPVIRCRRMVLSEHGKKVSTKTLREALQRSKRYLMTGEV